MRKTRLRNAYLAELFPAHDADGTQLSARLARLFVLYEDLRIEIAGFNAATIDCLDMTRSGARKFYFLRRSIGTLLEFADAVEMLERCVGFVVIRARFDEKTSIHWKRSVAFFRKHKSVLGKVRNDIGGHFGNDASTFAIGSFSAWDVGSVEEVEEIHADRPDSHQVLLLFAEQIVKTAFDRHFVGQSAPARAQSASRILLVGYGRAVRAVNAITTYYLSPKFHC